MKAFLTIAAALLVTVGVGYLGFPDVMLAKWGVATDGTGLYVGRRYGAMTLGLAAILLLARSAGPSDARAAILGGGVFFTGLITLLSLWGVLTGTIGPFAWSAVFGEAVLALGFAWYFVAERRTLTKAAVRALGGLLLLTGLVPAARAQEASTDPRPAPPRAEGEGPFERLIIRNAMLIDGTGAPPHGPVDIVIERNRIKSIFAVGATAGDMRTGGRPQGATREIDAAGMYVLPGFIDLHLHTGDIPKTPEAEYTYKLWLAHGITTGRGVPFASPVFSEREKGRSARNEITAPRMFTYRLPFDEWEGTIETPEKAREWVRMAAATGIDGLKLTAYPPEIMAALIDEAKKLGLGTTAHLSQQGVAEMNALDAVRLGLGTVTHFYGIFEALYDGHDVQPWPPNHNHADEQQRFGQVARQWDLVHKQGSPEWKALLAEFKERNVILDPTMTAYLASRNVMYRRNEDWHEKYTLPSLWDFYQPSRANHGSYYFDWTSWDEAAWRSFYRVWMAFLNDYKNMGGRVTVSSDAGYIFNTFGFSTIEEMELLQEAGFHPLEVIRGATMHAAQALFEPKNKPIEFGVVRAGLLADLVVVPENPIANLKVLYGTGAVRLNEKTGKAERVGGIKYTIKDGIVYDARKLLADVARMVEKQKTERGITRLPEIAFPTSRP